MISDFRLGGNTNGEALVRAMAKSMVDQETGQRGFLITGKDEFLEPFYLGQKEMVIYLMQIIYAIIKGGIFEERKRGSFLSPPPGVLWYMVGL